MDIAEIEETFALLDDWEERYRYVIELGRQLPPLPEEARNAENFVQGCTSQVWLAARPVAPSPEGPVLHYDGDSDAHIVKGLVAILLALYSDKPAREILATDAEAMLNRLGLRDHLTPQRSNGLSAMVRRIRADAEMALAHA